MELTLPNALVVQWGGRLKRVVLNVNLVKRVVLVTSPVKHAKIVLPVSFVQVEQKMALALILPNAVIVQMVGRLKRVAPNVNPVKRVRLVTLPVKYVKIVLPVSFVQVEQKLALALILPNVVVVQRAGRLKKVVLNANVVKRVRLVTLPVKYVKIVLPVSFAQVKQ